MTPERFRQIRNLFEAALEREAGSRSLFLAEACQGDEPLREEVGRLLAAHLGETAPVDRGGVLPELLAGEPGRMEGRRIDHYEILRELGRGGMGSVYLALRTDDVYRKPVALKVVRPEASTQEVIQRFRREREILASLDHPNLARLLDGGTTPEGLPYFVMDYVEGQPIDTYCDERQLNVAERLRLFRSVCAAVAYAHGRGVVHRDLKPGNILVTAEGTVKLLDFGIAKLVREEADEAASAITLTGMRLMTPEYASPEQVRGERVGTASDIYSLGVVLYELLTGHRPYRMRSRLIHEMVRVICEEEPTRPSTAVTEVEQRQGGGEKPVTVTPQSVSRARASTPQGLRRELSGDPDKIILKALRKDPMQRYATAEAFGEDVRRHLEGLPVEAQGESIAHRAWRFLLRYRVWVVAAAVIAVGLATGTVQINPLGPAVLVITPVALMVLFVLGIALLFGYGYVSLDFGRGASFGEVFLPALMSTICVLAAIWIYRSNPKYSSTFLRLFMLAFILRVAISVARWRSRSKWAGPLLLDLSKPEGTKLGRDKEGLVRSAVALPLTVGTMLIVYTIAAFAQHRGVTDLHWGDIFAVLVYSYLLLLPSYPPQTEIHERGILHRRAFLRWPRIESYAWQQGKGESVVLTVRARSLFGFLRTHKLFLTAEQKSPTNAIVARQLSEWPGQSSPVEG